ncbi:hypothetical protein GOP47_0008572 [Adiantum capillus-veneris]|uniref:5'-deoxynucleotidase n=1 Tax=Adiantum capillus-veneris TaxID=13818 RepID=A0A9D4ZJV2_ADICA|nr:hypothetical protein GOP47_0008572 [Adiantum capillus-veneris]
MTAFIYKYPYGRNVWKYTSMSIARSSVLLLESKGKKGYSLKIAFVHFELLVHAFIFAQLEVVCIVFILALSIRVKYIKFETTKRAGWVNHGLKETESIADHMHRMAVMAIIAADIPGLDRDKCVKMAVVHDIAEAIVGDITPSDGIPKQEKSRRERAAIDEMCKLLGGGLAAEEVKNLWLEYENNSTQEANLVKDLDKVEMILQALEYETTQGKGLDDFYKSTTGKFQTEVGKAWAAEIIKRRSSMTNTPQK